MCPPATTNKTGYSVYRVTVLVTRSLNYSETKIVRDTETSTLKLRRRHSSSSIQKGKREGLRHTPDSVSDTFPNRLRNKGGRGCNKREPSYMQRPSVSERKSHRFRSHHVHQHTHIHTKIIITIHGGSYRYDLLCVTSVLSVPRRRLS